MIRHIPKILVLNFFAIFITIIAGAQAPVQTYHYAARIPATAQSCQAEAEALGARFSSKTKAQVSEATCRGTIAMTADGSTYNLYSLLLTYQAASQIYPSATVLGGSSISATPGDGSGIYDTYALCVADIDIQTKNFEAATTLTALDSFCTASEDVGGFKYKLHIDGIGTKTNSLYVFNPKLIGDIDPQLQSGLENLVTVSGGVITKVSAGQIFYYSQYPLNLSSRMLGIFHNASECQAQISDATIIFANAGAKNIIGRCLSIGSRPQSSISLEVIDDATSTISQDYGSNNRFYSFNECMGEKIRIIQDGGQHTLGGVCIPASDLTTNFVLNLFTHY